LLQKELAVLAMNVLPPDKRMALCASLAARLARQARNGGTEADGGHRPPLQERPKIRRHKKAHTALVDRRILTAERLYLTIDEAIGLLCDAIAGRVGTEIAPRIEALIAEKIAAKALSIGPGDGDDGKQSACLTKGLRALDEKALRYELIKARMEKDELRFKKIVNELGRRHRAANIIETESRDDQ
jgi:hypothetical protein